MRLAALLLVLATTAASADEARREVPDYDGRGDDPTVAGDVLLWVPRILLAPAYLATEYALRRPLALGVRSAERHRVTTKLYEWVTFDRGRGGAIPTFLVDFGLRPSAGVFAFLNDVGLRGHDLRLRAAFGGTDWIAVGFTESLGPLALKTSFARRPDRKFRGTGPEVTDATQSRWGSDTLDATLGVTLPNLKASAGLHRLAYRAPASDEDPTLDARIMNDELARPAGFGEGYTVVRTNLVGSYDSRTKEGPGGGVRFEGRLEAAAEPDGDKRWLRAGATAGIAFDVTGTRRILGLAVDAELITALEGGVVPFPELVTVGGQGIMRGFREGQLVGESSLAATLTYSWPVWAFLDGTAHVAVGNVFGEHWQGFDPELLRMSAGLGLRAGSPEQAFEILFALGTETFEAGAEIETVRVLVGTHHGF